MLGTCRTMTDDERAKRKVPPGVEAYIVTLDVNYAREIVLLRHYDIVRDEFLVSAYSPEQWARAIAPPIVIDESWETAEARAISLRGRAGSPPDIGADVPGGGAV